MQDRPDARELADAVREFLEAEVTPAAEDVRLRFRLLVAMNALGILSRELTLGPALARREVESLTHLLGTADPIPAEAAEIERLGRALRAELAQRIRGGAPPEGTLAHLKAAAADKLRVASPRYLERYR